ncbi:MAG: sugar transferase [Phycisphaerales bacterium]
MSHALEGAGVRPGGGHAMDDAAAVHVAPHALPEHGSPDQGLAISIGVEAGPQVWGLGVREMHVARWASRGVQVVSRGRGIDIERSADLYLLLEPGQLVDFDIRPLIESLVWDNRGVVRVRILDEITPRYRERIVHDDDGRVIRVARTYRPDHRSTPRVLLTADPRLAEAWAVTSTRRVAWQIVRARTAWKHVSTNRVAGVAGFVGRPGDEARMLDDFVRTWPDPGRALTGLRHHGDGIWTTVDIEIDPESIIVGPAWIGAGSRPEAGEVLIGPAATDDRGGTALPVQVRRIHEIEPGNDARPAVDAPPAGASVAQEFAKRCFDILFALAVLAFGAPIFAIVALAVVIEDGRTIFYAQRREGRGGKEFGCWKFRSMFNGAEAIAARYQEANLSDGPHVNIKNDPRVTRVGRIIRKIQVDELPQFWNVLKGDMSVVGPRPSPERENQFCPAWREMRLSVRPGITGLWQVRRTRREGEDFQEWIRYDIEYVRRRSFGLDLKIILLTVRMMVAGRTGGRGR